MKADELEVAPGLAHENLQGRVFESPNEEELREAVEKAFDYRGDVTLKLKNGDSVEGYIFDRRESLVRLIPKGRPERVSIPYSDIAGLAFTGRDTAAGKSWEAWVTKYQEKKKAGERNIELQPESLDL